MQNKLKHAIFIFVFAANLVNSFSQSFNEQSTDLAELEANFRHEDIAIDPEEAFFNVLTIANNGAMPEVVQVTFNAPVGWTLIKEDRRSYTIPGGDSLQIPVRIASSREVKGEIGYSVIASVNDRDGHTMANAYCYLKIPGLSDLRLRPLTRISYFDQETGESEFRFRFENRGNIDEAIYINLASTENISLPRERNNELNFELRLESGKDTVITMPVELDDDNNRAGDQSLYRVDLNATSEDADFSTTFWFSHLTNSFRYQIPQGEIPLTAQFNIHNLFSEYDPYFSGSILGNILFSENRNLDYRFRAHGIGRTDDVLQRSRFRLAFNSPQYNIMIGDVSGISTKHGLGRGFRLDYRFLDRYEITGLAGENRFRPIRTYGGILNSRFENFNLNTRFAYTDNELFDTDARLYGAGTGFTLFDNHNISIDAGLSDVNFHAVDKQKFGYGLNVNYTGRINDLRIRLRERYGSTNYYGHYAGRHQLRGSIRYPYEDGLIFELRFNDRLNRPVIETSSGLTSERFTGSRRVNLRTTKYMDAGYALFFGPFYESRASNSYAHYDGTPFETNSANIEIGARIRESYNMTFSPSLELGYNFVTNYSIPGEDAIGIHGMQNREEFFNAHFKFNLRRRVWGTFLNYFYGPYGMHQQMTYFYRGTYTQNLRIMPYYESFIYEDMIELSSKLNFMHDFTYKTTRMHLQNQLDFYFDRGFSVSLLNTLSYQVSTDLITEDKQDYSNTYFEIRLKKDFHWDQPRVKYHDLTVHVFKDLQGTLEKGPNDPGINNILVTLHREDSRDHDDFEKEYDYTGGLVNNQLLSGMDGEVTYENLAAGIYRIEINNIGTEDNFVPEAREMIVHVNEDKDIYVPFLERHRIFGQVILNRSELSTLGRVDVSNIRIEAVDTRGNTISALTDGEGKYEIYAPALDDYVVSIRDVFAEHFNLRQNDFIVHLNAYSQFEVNFIFDEKRRRIDFHRDERVTDAEVISVRRTNLMGEVKDRSTLQPVRATIEIVDNETGRTIEATNSDRSTGRFNTSFRTEENYSLIVTAPGYWLHTERLDLEQALTIQDVEKEILLENIIVGSKIELQHLVFEAGSAEIPTEAYPELDRIIDQLKQNPDIRIQIAGHSDGLETMEHRDISVKRAEAVAEYMMEEGFGNIEYVGHEDNRPVAPDDTAENRARNRRVEITIVDK